MSLCPKLLTKGSLKVSVALIGNVKQRSVYRDLNVYPFLHIVNFVQGSIIKIHFKDEEHTVIEVLEKGTWAGDFITEGEAELSKKVPVRLEENKAFFADAGGLWTPMVSRFFSKLVYA